MYVKRFLALAVLLLATSSPVLGTLDNGSATIGSALSRGLSEKATEVITDRIRQELGERHARGMPEEERLRALQASTEDFDEVSTQSTCLRGLCRHIDI